MEPDLVKTEQDWKEQSTSGKSRMGRKGAELQGDKAELGGDRAGLEKVGVSLGRDRVQDWEKK
jgi:hypothetical protein